MKNTPPQADAETEVFSGPSLQLAMAMARAAYGQQVQVLRAVRVMAGLSGMLGRPRFDVVVRRPVPLVTVLAPIREAEPATESDPVVSVLDQLLDAAEASERIRNGEPPTEDTSWVWSQEQAVEELLEQLGERASTAGSPGPHPALDLAEHAALALKPAGPAALDSPGTGWDRDELRRLGVPGPVLSRLPLEDPSDDAGWRRALAKAIEQTVPAPAEPDTEHPVVVSGHGLLGVVAMLRAAIEDGASPGTVTHDGRIRPATPAALVEVLASCARS